MGEPKVCELCLADVGHNRGCPTAIHEVLLKKWQAGWEDGKKGDDYLDPSGGIIYRRGFETGVVHRERTASRKARPKMASGYKQPLLFLN